MPLAEGKKGGLKISMGWKDLLYLGLALVLIIMLVINANVRRTLDTISGIDIGLLLLILGLYFLNTAMKALRWNAIIRGMTRKRTGWITLPIFLASLALNNSTPGKIGGEPVRAYLLREHTDTRISVGAASIFSEKSLDILTILTFAILGAVYLIWKIGFDDTIGMIAGIIIVGILVILAIVLISNRRLMSASIRILGGFTDRFLRGRALKFSSKLVGKLDESAKKFHDSISRMTRDRMSFAGIIIMTIAIWFNEAVRLYLVILALPVDANVAFPGAVAGIAIANILGFILPIGAGNLLGSSSVLYLLTDDEGISTSASIAMVATSLWLSIPLGLISLFYLRRRSRN
ncbi:MAG: lysylphosphatidylglycerol synthase transmembrane domain-containing protein [Thermoplasmatota archaeon]